MVAVVDVRQYGAIPDGRDCTLGLNAAFAACHRGNEMAYLPAGDYPISGPLTWPGPTPRIVGVPGMTSILPNDTEYTWLTLGDGAAYLNAPAGYVADLRLIGPAGTPALGPHAGLRLDAVRFVTVERVFVHRASIGFDLDRNCHGSTFSTCRTLYGNCAVGVLLRGKGSTGEQFGSGNDIQFSNCWFHGYIAAIWKEPLGGGYSFHGGQFGLFHAGTGNDRAANVVMNATYADDVAAIGSGSLSFFGSSFEPTVGGWAFRMRAGGGSLELHSPFFKGTENAYGLISVGETSALGENERLTITNAHITGQWAQACVLRTNITKNAMYHEVGTYGIATFAGQQVDLAEKGLLALSNQRDHMHAFSGLYWIHNGVIHRRVADTIQVSFDWGQTWS